MEKPYVYPKKLVKMGHSVYVLVPNMWLQGRAKVLKMAEITDVIVEVWKDKIVITPLKK